MECICFEFQEKSSTKTKEISQVKVKAGEVYRSTGTYRATAISTGRTLKYWYFCDYKNEEHQDYSWRLNKISTAHN